MEESEELEIPEEEPLTTDFIQKYLESEKTSEIELKLKVLRERSQFNLSKYSDLLKLLQTALK